MTNLARRGSIAAAAPVVAGGALPVAETWTGTDGAAWPAQWAIDAGSGATSAIASNRGRLVTPTTGTYTTIAARLAGMPVSTDQELLVTVTPPTIASGAEAYTIFHLRSNGVAGGNPWEPQTGYALWVHRRTTNDYQVYIYKYVAGVGTLLSAQVTVASTWPATFKVRFQAIGSTIRAKVWSGTDEPAWTVTATDSSIASGRATLVAVKGAQATVLNFDYDDLTVTATSTAPPAFGAIGTYLAGTNRTSTVVATPTGAAVDSFLLVSLYVEATTTITPPAGWSALPTPPSSTGAGHTISLRQFWTKLTAAAAASYTFTHAGSASLWTEGHMTRYEGVTSAEVVGTGTSGAAAATAVSVSGSTTAANELLVLTAGNYQTGGWTPSAGFVERYDPAPGWTPLSTKVQAAAGATGTITYTSDSGTADALVATLIGLIP